MSSSGGVVLVVVQVSCIDQFAQSHALDNDTERIRKARVAVKAK